MNGRTNVTGGGSNGSLGGVIPLEAPSNFTVTPDNGKCLLTWTDPKDKYADELGEITDEGDQLVSQFAYTRIVRKVGSAPSSPTDGDLVTDSSTRNQYQSSAYTDDGLTNNTLYYYAAFICNTDGVYSGAAVGSGTPKSYDPILANNTWEQINDVANEGIASSVWNIGDEIDITLTTEETVTCVIAGFNHHYLSDGSGTAAITFVTKHLLAWRDNDTLCFSTVLGRQPGLYNTSRAFDYCQNQAINELPTALSKILQLIKSQYIITGSDQWGEPSGRPTDYTAKVFQLAINEIVPNHRSYGQIDMYREAMDYYTTQSNRIKKLNNGSGNPHIYGVSSNDIKANDVFVHFIGTNGSGGIGTHSTNDYDTGMSFAFCIGKTPA